MKKYELKDLLLLYESVILIAVFKKLCEELDVDTKGFFKHYYNISGDELGSLMMSNSKYKIEKCMRQKCK